MENRRIRVGDWVISNQADPFVAVNYSWLSCPLDTPLKVEAIYYRENLTNTLGDLEIRVPSTGKKLTLNIRRFKLYNRYTNTTLKSGGNV